tara:strand:+ start:180 stop:335 length:156 start_codon:yes stop_codon:yes gene_type:complete
MLVTLPGSPYEIGLIEVLCGGLSPPVTALESLFNDLAVVSWADVVFLRELQ